MLSLSWIQARYKGQEAGRCEWCQFSAPSMHPVIPRRICSFDKSIEAESTLTVCTHTLFAVGFENSWNAAIITAISPITAMIAFITSLYQGLGKTTTHTYRMKGLKLSVLMPDKFSSLIIHFLTNSRGKWPSGGIMILGVWDYLDRPLIAPVDHYCWFAKQLQVN